MTIVSMIFQQPLLDDCELQLMSIVKAGEIDGQLCGKYFTCEPPVVLVLVPRFQSTGNKIVFPSCLQNIEAMYKGQIAKRPHLPVVSAARRANDDGCLLAIVR